MHKYNFQSYLILILAIAYWTGSQSESVQAQDQLSLGSILPMPDHSMEDVTGRSFSLNNVARDNGLLVIFYANTCPWISRLENRFREISQIADANNVGIIAINSNEGYRDRGDSMEDMIRHVGKADYDFPYVLDENHQVADAFGATRTPDIYLFNGDLELVYVGPIDDNAQNENRVGENFLRNAIEAMVSGNEIVIPTIRPVGCRIKRAG